MSQKNLLDRNIEMWQKFIGDNTELMTQSVEKMMDASASLKRQVNEAVSHSMSLQLEAAMDMLKALERQVAGLTDRIDALFPHEKDD